MNRYVVITFLVWRTKSPDQKIKVRAASSSSACLAAAKRWKMRGRNGLSCRAFQPGNRADHKAVIAARMPQARIL